MLSSEFSPLRKLRFPCLAISFEHGLLTLLFFLAAMLLLPVCSRVSKAQSSGGQELPPQQPTLHSRESAPRRLSASFPLTIDVKALASQSFLFQQLGRNLPQGRLEKEHTHWSDFPEGTWIKTRLETENYREEKSFRNVTETRITLQEFENDHYRLKEEVAVEVGDQRFEDDPNFKQFDFYGQLLGQWDRITHQGGVKLDVCGRTVNACLRKYVRKTPAGKTETRVWFTPNLAPFILRVETTKTGVAEEEGESAPLLSKIITTTEDLGGFCGIGNRILVNYSTRTVQKKGPITVSTTSHYSSKVPGGLIRETTVEKGADGKIIRKSELTLTEFQLPHWNQGYSDSYRLDSRSLSPRRLRYRRLAVPLDASHSLSQ